MEALQLMPALQKNEIFFITVDRSQSRAVLKGKKSYFIEDTERKPVKLFKNFTHVLSIISKEKPDVIISTGAAAAIPALYAGKLIGSKIIFIESMAAIGKPSSSGKVAYHISDLFIVQWKSMLRYYKKGVYGEQLI